MTYRFKFDEPVDKAWRRIVREQIDIAIKMLSAGKDMPVAVHETRKAMKRIRALLKLLRTGLTDEVYKRENARYADIARLLSGTRDTQVLHATAQQLSEITAGKSRTAALALMKSAEKKTNAADVDTEKVQSRSRKSSTSAHTPAVAKAIDALKSARKSVEKLKLKSTSFSVVREGLTKSYRRARRAMENCYRSNHDEDFHEWRKWVQAHWRHMSLVSRAWPDLFAARMVLAKEMSDLLGADHDLYMLIEAARHSEKRGGAEVAAGVNGLIRAAAKQQEVLRAQLRTKGTALFAETADDFVARVEAYWDAALASRKAAREQRKSAEQKASPKTTGRKEKRKSKASAGRAPSKRKAKSAPAVRAARRK